MTPIPDARWREILRALRPVVSRRGVRAGDVDDVIQASVEKALRRLHTLSDEKSFEAWLKRIAANTALDTVRAFQRHPAHAELADAQAIQAPARDAEPLLSFADCVAPFLNRLSPTDAEALRLKDLHGLGYAELERRLSLSRPATKSRVHRARRRLARDLMSCCAALRRRPVADALAPNCGTACCLADAPT